MSNPGIPLQSAQNPAQPDEDLLAMLGLHPAQMAVAHGLASGAIAPEHVAAAVTPQPAAENPPTEAPTTAPSANPPIASPSATPSIASAAAPEKTIPASVAPSTPLPAAPSITGNAIGPRIAPPSPDQVTPPTPKTEAVAKLQHDTTTGSGLEQFQHRHPVLGGIARVAAGIGSAMFPGVAAMIPGTDLHHQVVLGQDRAAVGDQFSQEKEQGAVDQQNAVTNETNERARLAGRQADVAGNQKQGLTPDEQTFAQGVHQLLTGNNGQPILNPDTKKPFTPYEAALKAQGDIAQTKQDTKPTPGLTQEQNKASYQGVVSKLDAAGLPTDPKSIDKSLDKALKNKTITQQEHSLAKSYEAANQTPGTNLTVKVAGQEDASASAINKIFEGKEVLAHMPDGRRVLMSYADAKAQGIPPERLVAMNGKEAQDTRDKAASTGATFKSLDTYRTDLKTTGAQLTPGDRKAMEVLTSHVQSSPDFVGKIAGGIFDSLSGQPLTGYSEKVFDGLMTKDQYNSLSGPGKKLVSDYFTAIIANFANMKNIMGSVGRNPMQLQAEINTIPLPFLDWESANAQFENKRADLQSRASSQPDIYSASK